MATINHPVLGCVECVRSLRTRSIRIRIRPDGSIRVSYPIFASRQRAMAFVEAKQKWIAATRRRLRERREHYPTISREQVEALRREAHRTLPTLVSSLAARHGFSYSALRISSAHTRWGSCSGRNTISLSLFVMQLPDHLREFIILHELCHTRHHNHSEAFHQLLDSLVEGRERELNRELRHYTIPRIAT